MSELPLPLPMKSDNEERLIALLAHISMYLGIGLILGPVLTMVIKPNSPFVQDQSKEALNFHLTMLIISLVSCGIGTIVTVPMLLICSIIGGVSAYQGNAYRYPFTFNLVK
jgi:uncharacterized Tic20 family protein